MTVPRRARRFLVVGGGCYGAHSARSLLRAGARGTLPGGDVWVIDRDPGCAAAALPSHAGLTIVVADWVEFFSGYLGGWRKGPGAREEDLLVPTPLAPQLFDGWLVRALAGEARLAQVVPPSLPDTPLARLDGGRLTVSFAEWPCPVRCVEPAVCPATRQPRTWEIPLALGAYARRLRAAGLAPLAGPFTGRATHLVEGVAGFPLMDWARAARTLRSALAGRRSAAPVYALIGTGSGCHGSATLWRAEALGGGATDPA
jgi:hypothetical protein